MARTRLPSSQISDAAIEDSDGDTSVDCEESSDEDKIRFNTAGSERMIVDENGNVGIGTSSPSHPLHIYGNISNSYAALIDNDQGSAGHGLKITSDGTGSGTRLLDLESGSTTLFRFRADGRLGIGTTTPKDKLHVDGWISIPGSSTGKSTGIGAHWPSQSQSGSSYRRPILYAGTADGGQWTNIQSWDNHNTADGIAFRGWGGYDSIGDALMVIQNGGNVGIGTTNPSNKLEIKDGYLNVINNNQYIKIGSGNSLYAHIQTDAPRFWFNKDIQQHWQG